MRMVTAPYFLATKLEAFRGRGKGDFFSHDLGDVVSVVDGRESLTAEVRDESPELREYLAVQIEQLLASVGFLDALPGLLLPDAMSQARIATIVQRMQALAAP